MRLLACSVLASVVATGVPAPPRPVARTGKVVVVNVTVPDRAHLDALVAEGYDIDNVQGDVVTIYATPSEVEALRDAGYTPQEVDLNIPALTHPRGKAAKALGVYHDYTALTTALSAYAAAYGSGQAVNPDICRLYTLGQSEQGRELWAILITDNPDVEELEPEFKYVATMHGDEPLGTELCLYLIDLLLTSYGTDSRITDLVDGTAIWIVPLMNPDGREVSSRYNANGLDLNRNFPWYPGNYTGNMYDGEALHDGDRPAEAACVMQWTAQNSFVLSANFHTGALLVNYPYDADGVPSGVDAPTPDDLLFEAVSVEYSEDNTPMYTNPLFQPYGITNGAAWYVANGSMQDWNYRYASCNEVTIELSNTKWPMESLLPTFWAQNQESMLSYMEAAHWGVCGVVTDADTSAPLWAKVTVQDNAHPVFTDADVGDYHRMLLPGTYTLTYSADGYIPVTVTGVVVTAGSTTRLDVTLDPLPYYADVNGDGEVDALDIQLTINAILGFAVAHDCDVDGSGFVDVVDLQHILNASAFF